MHFALKPVSFILLPLTHVHSISMFLVVQVLSFVTISVFVGKLSYSVHFHVSQAAFIPSAIKPDIDTKAFHAPSHKFASV